MKRVHQPLVLPTLAPVTGDSALLPLVTIITPTFNSAATLTRTVQSVRNQTYPHLQYIIVDGGSTDGTLDIIRENEDFISTWVSEPDGGIYHAMNKGIARARGDIVGIVNSDDMYYPTAIAAAVEALASRDAEVAYGNVLFVTKQGDGILHRPKSVIKQKDFWHMPISHPGVFVRREAYIKHGNFDTKYRIAADYDLMLRLFKAGSRFVHIDLPVAIMYDGGASTSSKLGWLEVGHILRAHRMPAGIYGRYLIGLAQHVAAQEIKAHSSLSGLLLRPYRRLRARSGYYTQHPTPDNAKKRK